MKLRQIIGVLWLLTIVFQTNSNAQTCASNSRIPYEWPGHRNWFISPNAFTGAIIDMQTMNVTQAGDAWNPVRSYEAVSAASDDQGNLLFYTNGRSLWTGTGANVNETYNGLLTGNEAGLANGSASQGVITVRHPLDPERYWIITTDDALAATQGLNAFSFDSNGNLLSGPQRLGNFRTSEGISATFHENGVDIWVTVLESGTGFFSSFLLKCDGFQTPGVRSPGPTVDGNRERGGVAFSWDGNYFAQAHPNWWPDNDKIVSIYRFNKTTGQLYDPKNVSGAWGSPYDITWSPNNQRVYVSMQNGAVHYLDISSWNEATINGTWTSTGINTAFASMEIGPNGDMFLAHGVAGGGALRRVNGNLNNGNAFNASAVPGTNGMSHLGLPTIFLPPAEEPIIDPVADMCTSDAPIDLSTNWMCSGLDAEDPANNPNAYSGPGITNAAIGTFDPSVAGVGTHDIIFTYCSVDDTIQITVTQCGDCEVDVVNTAEICVGETVLLDPLVLDNNGIGTWSIDSMVAGAGTNPSININAGDTIFDATNINTNPGVYKLIFEVDAGGQFCRDSLYITVRPLPEPTIVPFGPLCIDSVNTVLTADSTEGLAWYINDVLAGNSPANVNFDPSIVGEGTHEVKVIVTNDYGCIGLDSIDVQVLDLPDSSVTPIGPFCANEAGESITVGEAGGVWSATCGACIDQTGYFDVQTAGPGTHQVTYTFQGRCGADSTIDVVVHPMPNVTIDAFGPLCEDSVSIVLTSDSTGQGGTSDWFIDDAAEVSGNFNPTNLAVGIHEVKLVYTSTNNCVDVDSIDVDILALPDTSVTPIGPFCANETGETITVAEAGGVWSATCGACIDQTGYFDVQTAGPGTHQVTYTFQGRCGADSTIDVVVHPMPNITIDAFGPICEDSVPAIAMSHDSIAQGGTTVWLIDGAIQANGQFDAAQLDTGMHTITAMYLSTNNCGDTSTLDVEILPVLDPTIAQVGPYCANEPSIQLVTIDTGGTWSGTGVDANGNFDPNTAGAGDHIIRYEFGGQCGTFDTITIRVNPVQDAEILMPDSQSVCLDGAVINLSATDPNGVWTVNGGVINDFDPSNYAAGDYEIIHTLADPCGDADTVKITVLPLKDASFNTAQTVFCADDDSVQFVATQNGGIWSGAGINPNTGWFNPANANIGTYFIYYNQPAPCPDIDSVEVTVNPVRDATIQGTPGDSMTFCILDPNPVFTVAETGGTWNNVAVNMAGNQATIDLMTLGDVANEMLIYSIADPCGDADTIWVTTSNQLDATINNAGPFCENDNDVQLTLANPSPGVWSSDCGACLNATGLFSPANAGAGNHTITYTIGGNCGDTYDLNIEVRATPDPTINLNPTTYCEYDNAFNITTNQNGGNWDFSDAIGSGFDTTNLSFDPEIAGGGDYNLIYSFGGLCPASDTVTVTIIDTAVITMPILGPYCGTDAAVVLNATPDTGVWSGPGVVAGSFDPSIAGVGTHQITYQIQGACPVSRTMDIEVLPTPNPQITPLPILCNSGGAENLIANEAGGDWYINGVPSTDSFNPQNIGVGSHEVVYEIPGQCSNSDTIQVDVVSAPNIQINAPSAICEGTQPEVTFTATPNGGTWGGDVNNQGVLVNSRSGVYEITYEVSDVCVARDTIEFEILRVPEPSFEGTILEGCIPFTETFINTTDTTGAGEITSSTWTFGNGLQSISEQQATTPYNQAGTYDVTLVNQYANGCIDSVTYPEYINAFPIPLADFDWTPEIPSTTNGFVQFQDLSQDAQYYAWDFSTIATEQNSTDINPLVEFIWNEDTVVDITLIVTNDAGCADTIVKPMTYHDVFTIYVPNAFTPDGNGLNDDFRPRGKNIPADDYEFMIFNRWGDLIWDTQDLNEGWDGTVKSASSSNEVQQVDVYVWKVVTRNPYTRERVEMVGTVTLLR
jgi:gliding motility-associated-like protein